MQVAVLLESGMGVARHLEGPPLERYSVEVKEGVTYAEVVKADVPYAEVAKVDVRYVALGPRKRAVRYHGYVLEHEACLAPPESQQQGADVPTLIHMARGGVILGRKRAVYQEMYQRKRETLTVYGPPSMYKPVESLATTDQST
jgi:hypothetical protein